MLSIGSLKQKYFILKSGLFWSGIMLDGATTEID